MKCLFIALVLNGIFFSPLFAQNQTNTKKYRLLIYGLPRADNQNARKIIADKWGIEFYAVAGCIVSQELVDSVKKENANVFKLLESKYGENCKEIFSKEIDEEYKIEKEISELVRNQSFAKNKQVDPSPAFTLPMYPIDDRGTYIVTLTTYDRESKKGIPYKLQVNYKTSHIEIMKD